MVLDVNTPFKGIDAKALAGVLALDAIQASGSSASQREGFVHYRMFNYMPERKSLSALSSSDDKPSVALQLAPAGADLVLEMHANGSHDPEFEGKSLTALGPIGKMLSSQMEESLKENPEHAKMKSFFSNLNSRLTFIGDISPEGFNTQKGFPVTGEFLVAMTNAEDAWKQLRETIEADRDVILVDGDIETAISPEEIAGWLPVLRYDRKSKRLMAATSAQYLELCLKTAQGDSPSLGQDPEFMKISEGLPDSFSTMAYVSPQFAKTAFQLSLFVVPEIKNAELRPAVQQLVDLLRSSDLTKTGTFYAGSVQDNGSLHVVNTPVSLPKFTTTPSATAGVALAGVSSLFIGASYYKDNADKAACVINLSSIQKATRALQNIEEYNAGDALTWEILTGEGGPLNNYKPTCPSGGTYTLSPTFPAEGKPVVECSHEGHVLETR